MRILYVATRAKLTDGGIKGDSVNIKDLDGDHDVGRKNLVKRPVLLKEFDLIPVNMLGGSNCMLKCRI